jgi:hypothetical protein
MLALLLDQTGRKLEIGSKQEAEVERIATSGISSLNGWIPQAAEDVDGQHDSGRQPIPGSSQQPWHHMILFTLPGPSLAGQLVQPHSCTVVLTPGSWLGHSIG